jgi:hypothetical protein
MCPVVSLGARDLLKAGKAGSAPANFRAYLLELR